MFATVAVATSVALSLVGLQLQWPMRTVFSVVCLGNFAVARVAWIFNDDRRSGDDSLNHEKNECDE